ncbi:MAG TPA: hypothetical protein VNC18_11470 [Gemmatimonadaceae bacterium]|jgi:hypothetical protein|nr:hypothetical protein [Gemmatimonadaceae bacterium]
MKALVYQGPRGVAVENVPDAKLGKPTDVLAMTVDKDRTEILC